MINFFAFVGIVAALSALMIKVSQLNKAQSNQDIDRLMFLIKKESLKEQLFGYYEKYYLEQTNKIKDLALIEVYKGNIRRLTNELKNLK